MKVYLAAPFFTDEQRKNKENVRALLRTCKDVELLDPQDYNLGIYGWEMTNHEWGKSVFTFDIAELNNADAVIAIDYGLYSDTGTAWEIGYAYAMDIPIITVVPNNAIAAQHSLMVGSASKIFCSLKRFCNELVGKTFQEFLNNGKLYNLLGVELK